MTLSETLAILLWFVIVLALFIYTTPRRAILAGLVGGWLFLPDIKLRIAGALPDLTKASITGLGLLALVIVLNHKRLWTLRPRWYDLPILIWCLEPFVTALVNGESAYEGISAVVANTIVWGIPYLLGRLYLQDAEGWRDLAFAIFFGGLAYIPLCWFEIIAGPQLASLIYGYTPAAVETAFRFGGWRPVVFMQNGLMVALWMTAASVSGFWLWRMGVLPRVGRVPTGILVVLLCLTTFALKSVNAWALLIFGIGILWLSTRWRTTWLVWGTLALILLYVGVRAGGLWNGQELTSLTTRFMDYKTLSVAFRFENERQLAERARHEPILGWGRWGRAFLPDAWGNPNSAADSAWIIAFGQQGTVGLAAFLAFLLLPVILLLRRVPVADWSRAEFAPAVALTFVLLLYMIDNLANAMPNPVYMLAAGGLLMVPRGVTANTPADADTIAGQTPLSVQTRGT